MVFKKENWPEGTIYKKGNGKEEIILPKPTRFPIRKRQESKIVAKKDELSKKELAEQENSPQSSVEQEAIGNDDEWEGGPSQKKYPTRQENIVKQKRQARRFKDETKGELSL